MATLAGNTIASTYPLLLKIDSNGIDGTLRVVEDGDATDSALLIATNKVEVKPGSNDANAFEVSQADGTAVFTVDSSNSRVGIGKAPDTPLHIKGASDTYVTVEAGASDGNVGLLFDDSGSNQHGFVLYDTDDDIMTFGSANTTAVTINSSQDVTFASWITVTEGLIVNESGGDNDVRMESQNNDNMFRLDASTDRIGIGTSSPIRPLSVSYGAAKTSTSTAYAMSIQSNESSGQAALQFYAVGGASAAARKWQLQTTEVGVANAGIIEFQPDGGVVSFANNVGIGTSSPGDYSTSADNLVVYDANHAGITIASPTNKSGSLFFADGTSGDSEYEGFIQYDHGNNVTDAMMFGTAGSERMRITSDGRLGIGITAANAKLDIKETSNGQELIHLNHTVTGANQIFLAFKHDNTVRGTIIVNDSTDQIVYNTTSDERVKENIVEVNDALSIVNKIPVKQFNFIGNEQKTSVIGYIGQELIKEYPQAVTITKTDDFDDYHMVDESKMVAVLMKAVQELSAKVEALENA